MVSKLEAALAEIQADLDAARSAGNEKKVRELEENLASRQAFLDMARRPPPTLLSRPRACERARRGAVCAPRLAELRESARPALSTPRRPRPRVTG